VVKAFGLHTGSKISKPSTENNTTTKSRKRRNKDIVSTTMRDNFVVKRKKVPSCGLGREWGKCLRKSA